MAAYNRKGITERMVLHAFLIGFSMVFVFPFIWMVCNSAKVQGEMASSKFRLLPTAPHVTDATPYFDTAEFDKVEYLDLVDRQVWESARPEIEIMLKSRLRSWTPKVPGDPEAAAIPAKFAKDYEEAMMRGLMFVISNRISDDVREFAAKENARLWRNENPGIGPIPKKLLPEAVEAGSRAIVGDAGKIVTEDLLQDTFDRVFRRFCLSKVKIRTGNRIEVVDSKDGWRVASGNAKLAERSLRGMKFKEADIDYAGRGNVIFAYRIPSEDSTVVDRMYVGFRGDASWARICFEVARDGKIYRTDDVITCSGPSWTEIELRWATDKADPIARKSYYALKESGAGVGKDFEIRVKLMKSGLLQAWHDKIMRNYLSVFREVPFARYIMTSFCLCILNIVLTIFSCTITAYAFSRLEWPGRNVFFAIMLATMMIPGQVVMIPGFLINRHL
ncbi:MAG: hypothetical protein WC637_15905, partial [Victivallales bacterium]